MGLIIFIMVAVYIFIIVWTWNNLGQTEKTKKIFIIAAGFIIMYLITLIIFTLSKKEIQYETIAIERNIKNILVALFTAVNSLILPFIAKVINDKKEEEIEQKQFTRIILVIIIIFLFFSFFESGYMKSTQEGILKIYQAQEKK